MNFIEAFSTILKGEKVVRITQENTGHQYINKANPCVCDEPCIVDERNYSYKFSTSDYYGTWMIYPEPKLHTFEEALKAYKSGKYKS